MVGLGWSLPWWTPYTSSFRKWYKYYCGWYFYPDYYSNASLIQPQHTGADPDKYFDVLQNPTKTSLEIHSNKVKKGGGGGRGVIEQC